MLFVDLSLGITETITFGKINVKFEIDSNFKKYYDSVNSKIYKMPIDNDGCQYEISVYMKSPYIILTEDDMSISHYLFSLVSRENSPTYKDYLELMNLTQGPAYYKELYDYMYTGYERFIIKNGLIGERYFSCGREEGILISGPFMLIANIVTSEGILEISAFEFSGAKNETEKALSYYGKNIGTYVKIKSQQQFDNIYQDMKTGESNSPKQLRELYLLFEKLLSTAVIIDNKK